MEPTVEITHRIEFSSSHVLRNPDWSEAENQRVFGICANLHGHNYALEATVAGPVRPATGMVMDLKALAELLDAKIFRVCDHKDLNTQVPFLAGKVPTAEVLAVACWDELQGELAAFEGVRLVRVRVYESRTSFVDYLGPVPRPSGASH